MKRTVIRSTGKYLPPRIVTNEDLTQWMETSDEWIEQRTGIKQRHWVPEEGGVGASDLGLEASKIALERAGWRAEDLDLIILHQANQRIIHSAVTDLGVAPERVFVNLQKYGNTSAASIPLALDEAAQAGRIKRGDHVLMCGFGAGLAWGTALVRY